MFRLIELLCVYYCIGLLINIVRSIPPEDLSYNNTMWGPILIKKLWFDFMSYLARFQAELTEDTQEDNQ